MPSATVRIKKNSSFTFDDVVAFFDWALVEATPQNPTSTALTLVGTYAGASVVASVTGSGFVYTSVGGFTALVGGSIKKVAIKVGGVDAATVTTNINAKTLSNIVLKDVSGNDPAAIEKHLMGFNWTFHDSDASGVLPSLINGVPVNLRGNDKIYLNGGKDIVSSGGGNDVVDGGGGNDTLFGAAGNDVLKGGAGKDKLEGGIGKDKLVGGAARDQFIFRDAGDSTVKSKGQDTIADFDRGERDKINLKAIDADVGPGKQSFDFIGDASFSKNAGELRYKKNKASTVVQADLNGDGKADFAIKLAGAIDLQKGDFVL